MLLRIPIVALFSVPLLKRKNGDCGDHVKFSPHCANSSPFYAYFGCLRHIITHLNANFLMIHAQYTWSTSYSFCMSVPLSAMMLCGIEGMKVTPGLSV